jgi:aerobic-type carbon monoxide dehydrogenase small subunit (CoxS/CutS family)
MAEELKIRVNERVETVMVDPDTPLLYVLANELGLKGGIPFRATEQETFHGASDTRRCRPLDH